MWRFVVVTGILCVCLGVLGDDVGASDWVSATSKPVIIRNEPIVSALNEGCGTFYQKLTIAGHGEQNVCVYGGETRVGTFTVNGQLKGAIGMRYDTRLYSLEGVCSSGLGCRYSDATDVLVSKEYGLSSRVDLRIYTHLSDKVTLTIDNRLVPVVRVDEESYDLSLEDIGGYALANNGKWLVAEVRNRGVVLVDLVSLQTRMVTTNGYQYGRGLDPIEELAVSNDGKTVVVTGYNAGLAIMDITVNCGLPVNPCRSTDIDVPSAITHFRSAHAPRFDDTGQIITMILQSSSREMRRLVVRPPGTGVLIGIEYIALGDSFSSGEGEDDDTLYLPGTNDGVEKCHTSSRSYPFWFGEKAEDINSVVNVACSGAQMSDIVSSASVYRGQGDRLLRLGFDELMIETWSKDAVSEFIPGRVPQQTFVDTYLPRIVSVGIGGNDAGLMGKLRSCAMPTTCEWVDQENKLKTAAEIMQLKPKLVELYRKLLHGASIQTLYAMGYSSIITTSGQCDGLTGLLFDPAERVFMYETVKLLNQTIRAATIEAGVTYVDNEDSFLGHQLCSQTDTPAVNGIRLGGDIGLGSLKFLGSETFHPTPYGQRLIGDRILGAHRGSITTSCESCASVTNVSYWGDVSLWVGRISEYEEYARAGDAGEYGALFPSGYFQSDADVTVTLGDEMEPMYSGTTAADGSLTCKFALNEELETGIYTLRLHTKTRTGLDIELYQFIEHQKHDALVEKDGRGEVPMVASSSTVAPPTTVDDIDVSIVDIQWGSVLGTVIYRSPIQGHVDRPVESVSLTARRHTPQNPSTVIVIIGAAAILIMLGCLLYVLSGSWTRGP